MAVECIAAGVDLIKDVVVPLAAALGGGIIGAVAGYFPARRLAKSASKEMLRRDATERREQQARAARQVYVKLHILANSIGSFHKQIEEMIARADANGNSQMRIFERLSTFPGIEKEPAIEFTAEELEIFISGSHAEYMDRLLLASRQYSACMSNLAAFGKLKTEWYELTISLGQSERNESGISRTKMVVPTNIANYLRVKGEELEIFAREMRELVSEWKDFAFDVAGDFENATRHLFEVGKRPGFATISNQPTVAANAKA